MRVFVRLICVLVVLLLPSVADAQIATRIRSMHEVLEQLYVDMMP